MKYLLILGLLLSCGSENDSGMTIKTPELACIGGIVYYYNYGTQYGGGYMSPKFDIRGKLESCSMEPEEKK